MPAALTLKTDQEQQQPADNGQQLLRCVTLLPNEILLEVFRFLPRQALSKLAVANRKVSSAALFYYNVMSPNTFLPNYHVFLHVDKIDLDLPSLILTEVFSCDVVKSYGAGMGSLRMLFFDASTRQMFGADDDEKRRAGYELLEHDFLYTDTSYFHLRVGVSAHEIKTRILEPAIAKYSRSSEVDLVPTDKDGKWDPSSIRDKTSRVFFTESHLQWDFCNKVVELLKKAERERERFY